MVDPSSLNANQLEAVKWANGPLLVLAGPGSGKTRVLTYRIARILEETAGQHFRILGLTFTNKAAAEMRQRIDLLVPTAGTRVLLTTFHSFCASTLRQHGHHIGLRPDFTILSQELDREAVLSESVSCTRSDHHVTAEVGNQLLPIITGLLDQCVPADGAVQALQRRRIEAAEAVGAVYRNYRRLMIENNQLDFAGLIAETLSLLEKRPAVRRQINKIYTHVCVDEFQDTNLAQYRILSAIVRDSERNLFVVADDDQIIYQWNGASPERLRELRRDFSMAVLQLPENYRCPPEVIDAANRLIGYNLSHDYEKKALLASKKTSGDSVIRVECFNSFEEEAAWIASEFASQSLQAREGWVVLGRTRKLLERVVEVLNTKGVESYLAIRKNEFTSTQMIWLHAMLRLANARQDRRQLSKVCKSFYDLEGSNLIVQDIEAESAAADGDYLRAWRRAALQLEHLRPTTRVLLTIPVANLADRLEFWSFINESFAWFENLPECDLEIEDGMSEYLVEKSTWLSLANEVTREFGKEQVTLNVLLQELELRSKAPIPPKFAVPCFTIHASKGMEYRHVYLVGLVEDQLPIWAAVKKGESSHEMQEERRNCFVAVTRVQERLTLTYSREVFGWPKEPSRFLSEMGLVS